MISFKSHGVLSSRLEMTKNRIIDLEGRKKVFFQCKQQRENRLKNTFPQGNNIKKIQCFYDWSLRKRKKKWGAERICKVIMAENFPNLAGDITYRFKRLSKPKA